MRATGCAGTLGAMQHVPEEFIALAHRMADAAGEVIRPRFRKPFDSEIKADASPVTEVDRAVETRLREIVAAAAPEHGFQGEEFATERPDAEFVWVVDPIDGTVSFMAGAPIFATLIALRHGGDYVLGVLDQAISRERWIGADGHGASMNGAPIRTRACPLLNLAVVNTTGPDDLPDGDFEIMRPIHRACRQVMYGDSSYDYGLLAMGFEDVIVDSDLDEHDFAAPTALIRNAGGATCDWQGAPLRGGSSGQVLMVGDPALLEPCLELLRG